MRVKQGTATIFKGPSELTSQLIILKPKVGCLAPDLATTDHLLINCCLEHSSSSMLLISRHFS